MNRVWFVTGCSTGFGKTLSEQIIASGDRLVATARKKESLSELFASAPDRILPLALDVTNAAQRKEAVAQALGRFKQVDVLVNNAGYGTVGAVEETSEEEIRRVFETNVFALVEMTRAFLPHFRERKAGHIINLSSVAGLVARGGFGVYNGTKFAVEGLSEAMAQELAPLGIRLTIVEPGPFRTDFASRSLFTAPPMPDYASSVGPMRHYIGTIEGKQEGDPVRAAKAMVDLVSMENPPLRYPMGRAAVERIRAKLGEIGANVDRMEDQALATDFPKS